MAAIGDLVVRIGADRTGLTKGLHAGRNELRGFARDYNRIASDMESKSRRGGGLAGLLGMSAGGALGALGGYFSGRAIIGQIQNTLELYETQIQAEKKLAAVLRATGGAAGLTANEIKAYAGELQGLTNFGDEATIGAAAVLATFKEVKGDQFKEGLALIQDMAAVMGKDLQSGAVQLGKALNDPIRGVSALAEVGVSFTQTQRDMIRSLQESGDMMGAQAVILRELESEFGGAAAAMADPVTQAKNAIGDLGETVGGMLAPYVKAAAEDLTKLVNATNSGISSTSGLTAAIGLLADELQLVIKGWRLAELTMSRFALAEAAIDEKISGLFAGAFGDDTGHKAAVDDLQKAGLRYIEALSGAGEILDETPWSMRAEEMLKGIEEAMAKGAGLNSEYADSWDGVGSAADRAADILTDAQKQLDRIGLSDAQKAILDASEAGATDEQLGAIADIQRRLEERKEQEQREKEAEREAERMQSEADALNARFDPAERVRQAMEKYDPLLRSGQISQDVYDKAMADARGESSSTKSRDVNLLGAMGKADTMAALFRAIGVSQGRDAPAEKTAKNTEKAAKLLAELNRNIMNGDPGVTLGIA